MTMTTDDAWYRRPGSVDVALRVAGRFAGRGLTPALRRAVEIVGRCGVVLAGRHAEEGRASPSVLQALVRRGILDPVAATRAAPFSAVPSAIFSGECAAELDRATRPVTILPIADAVRGYLAALDARRAANSAAGEGGHPLRGQSRANLSALRQRLLDQAEDELRRASAAEGEAGGIDRRVPQDDPGDSWTPRGGSG